MALSPFAAQNAKFCADVGTMLIKTWAIHIEVSARLRVGMDGGRWPAVVHQAVPAVDGE